MLITNFDRIGAIMEPALRAARVPGAAIAIVIGDRVVFARGYGCRDLTSQLPMDPDTAFPIASTTKAINATLLGILVDKGRLAWDIPIQRYLPRFRLQEPLASAAVTLRDLVTMRTGLPRHDGVWMGNPISRAELVEAFAHLPPSAGFRERFQYNNLTVTLAGHIAEIVSGERWEDLVRNHILQPLHMGNTGFTLPESGNVTSSYHENNERQLVTNRRVNTRSTAPAGGAIHSTINDMARWIACNLSGGKMAGRQVIAPHVLAELHSPQVLMGEDPIAPSENAAYGLGWAIDSFDGQARITHGGDLHDVISCATLFPAEGVGIVSFVNLAVQRLARAVNQCAYDVMRGIESDAAIAKALLEYEKKIESTRTRRARVIRINNTVPSHALGEYVGTYRHLGYGQVEIRQQGQALIFARGELVLPMEHWHYDAWVIADDDRFPIYRPHPYERVNRIVFDTGADGDIAAFSVQLEPATGPIRFEKHKAAGQ